MCWTSVKSISVALLLILMLQSGLKCQSDPHVEKIQNLESWCAKNGLCKKCVQTRRFYICSIITHLKPHGDVCSCCYSCVLMRERGESCGTQLSIRPLDTYSAAKISVLVRERIRATTACKPGLICRNNICKLEETLVSKSLGQPELTKENTIPIFGSTEKSITIFSSQVSKVISDENIGRNIGSSDLMMEIENKRYSSNPSLIGINSEDLNSEYSFGKIRRYTLVPTRFQFNQEQKAPLYDSGFDYEDFDQDEVPNRSDEYYYNYLGSFDKDEVDGIDYDLGDHITDNNNPPITITPSKQFVILRSKEVPFADHESDKHQENRYFKINSQDKPLLQSPVSDTHLLTGVTASISRESFTTEEAMKENFGETSPFNKIPEKEVSEHHFGYVVCVELNGTEYQLVYSQNMLNELRLLLSAVNVFTAEFDEDLQYMATHVSTVLYDLFQFYLGQTSFTQEPSVHLQCSSLQEPDADTEVQVTTNMPLNTNDEISLKNASLVSSNSKSVRNGEDFRTWTVLREFNISSPLRRKKRDSRYRAAENSEIEFATPKSIQDILKYVVPYKEDITEPTHDDLNQGIKINEGTVQTFKETLGSDEVKSTLNSGNPDNSISVNRTDVAEFSRIENASGIGNKSANIVSISDSYKYDSFNKSKGRDSRIKSRKRKQNINETDLMNSKMADSDMKNNSVTLLGFRTFINDSIVGFKDQLKRIEDKIGSVGSKLEGTTKCKKDIDLLNRNVSATSPAMLLDNITPNSTNQYSDNALSREKLFQEILRNFFLQKFKTRDYENVKEARYQFEPLSQMKSSATSSTEAASRRKENLNKEVPSFFRNFFRQRNDRRKPANFRTSGIQEEPLRLATSRMSRPVRNEDSFFNKVTNNNERYDQESSRNRGRWRNLRHRERAEGLRKRKVDSEFIPVIPNRSNWVYPESGYKSEETLYPVADTQGFPRFLTQLRRFKRRDPSKEHMVDILMNPLQQPSVQESVWTVYPPREVERSKKRNEDESAQQWQESRMFQAQMPKSNDHSFRRGLVKFNNRNSSGPFRAELPLITALENHFKTKRPGYTHGISDDPTPLIKPKMPTLMETTNTRELSNWNKFTKESTQSSGMFNAEKNPNASRRVTLKGRRRSSSALITPLNREQETESEEFLRHTMQYPLFPDYLDYTQSQDYAIAEEKSMKSSDHSILLNGLTSNGPHSHSVLQVNNRSYYSSGIEDSSEVFQLSSTLPPFRNFTRDARNSMENVTDGETAATVLYSETSKKVEQLLKGRDDLDLTSASSAREARSFLDSQENATDFIGRREVFDSDNMQRVGERSILWNNSMYRSKRSSHVIDWQHADPETRAVALRIWLSSKKRVPDISFNNFKLFNEEIPNYTENYISFSGNDEKYLYRDQEKSYVQEKASSVESISILDPERKYFSSTTGGYSTSNNEPTDIAYDLQTPSVFENLNNDFNHMYEGFENDNQDFDIAELKKPASIILDETTDETNNTHTWLPLFDDYEEVGFR